MIMIRKINRHQLTSFIRDQNSKRIRQVSFDFYQTSPEIDFISLGIYSNENLIGVTAGAYTNQFGITLIDINERNKGHGTSLLQHKINHFLSENIKYKTLVAEDNIISRKMCDKCNMLEIDRYKAIRRNNEEYNVITYSV